MVSLFERFESIISLRGPRILPCASFYKSKVNYKTRFRWRLLHVFHTGHFLLLLPLTCRPSGLRDDRLRPIQRWIRGRCDTTTKYQLQGKWNRVEEVMVALTLRIVFLHVLWIKLVCLILSHFQTFARKEKKKIFISFTWNASCSILHREVGYYGKQTAGFHSISHRIWCVTLSVHTHRFPTVKPKNTCWDTKRGSWFA